MSHPLIVMGGTLPKYDPRNFKSCTNKKTIFFSKFSKNGKEPMRFYSLDDAVKAKIRLFIKDVKDDGTETVSEVLYKDRFISLDQEPGDEPVEGSFYRVLESDDEEYLFNIYVHFLITNRQVGEESVEHFAHIIRPDIVEDVEDVVFESEASDLADLGEPWRMIRR